MGLENQLPIVSKGFHFSTPSDAAAGNRTSKRHILFVIDQLCEMSGAERVLLNTIRLLPGDRFRSSLITFKLDPSIPFELPCPLWVWPLKKTYDWNAVRVALQLRSFLRRENVDIVHTLFETSDLWAGPVSKLSAPVKLVSGRRDMGILRSSKHNLAYRMLSSIFDQVIAVSDQVRDFCISEDHLAPQKVVTIYNGLDFEKLSAYAPAAGLRSSLGIRESAPLIIFVGNIRRVKGIDVLVEAAARVVRTVPETVFLVVGRQSEPAFYEEVAARIEALGIGRSIRFLGESGDVYPLLKASDIFFLPSRSEGFSNALIEAMACGLPCVATRVGGNAEAINDGENGFLTESGDAKVAAERISALLADRDLRLKMSAAARTTVKAKFTAQIMIEKLVSCYDQLLAGKGH